MHPPQRQAIAQGPSSVQHGGTSMPGRSVKSRTGVAHQAARGRQGGEAVDGMAWRVLPSTTQAAPHAQQAATP
jgi:hypothetical protein